MIMKQALLGVAIVAAVFVASSADARKPYLNLDGETSFDGLYPVKRTHFDKAWASSELDLSGYDKVVLLSAGLHYRPVKDPGRSSIAISRAEFFPVSDRQKEQLQELAREEFAKELKKLKRFEVVSEPGPGVLAVRGGIYDIVSRVPPKTAGRGDYYLSSVGEATLVLELVDVPSNSVLARVVDSRTAEQRGFMAESNTVTNRAEARRVMNQWARLLRSGLEKLVAVDAEGKVVRN
jgi:hypothetical protein